MKRQLDNVTWFSKRQKQELCVVVLSDSFGSTQLKQKFLNQQQMRCKFLFNQAESKFLDYVPIEFTPPAKKQLIKQEEFQFNHQNFFTATTPNRVRQRTVPTLPSMGLVKNETQPTCSSSDDSANRENTVLEMLVNFPDTIFKVPDDFLNQYFILKAIKLNPLVFVSLMKSKDTCTDHMRKACEVLICDNETMAEMIQKNGKCLEFASEQLKNDRRLVLQAVQQNGMNLKYASESLKDDFEIVQRATQNCNEAMGYVSQRVQNDKQFVMALVANNGHLLRYVSQVFKNDMDVVKKAIHSDVRCLGYASDEIRENRQFILDIIKTSKHELEELKRRKKVQRTKLLKIGEELFGGIISLELRKDKEFVLEALKLDPSAILKCLVNTPEFYMEALKCNGLVLRHLSSYKMKGLFISKEMKVEAVKQCGYVSAYSEEFYKIRMDHCYPDLFLPNEGK